MPDLTLSGDSIVTKEALDPTLTPGGLGLRIPDYVGSAEVHKPR